MGLIIFPPDDSLSLFSLPLPSGQRPVLQEDIIPGSVFSICVLTGPELTAFVALTTQYENSVLLTLNQLQSLKGFVVL